MSYIKDRWTVTVEGPDGKPVKRRAARHGQGKRWQAVYEDESGKRHSQCFARKVDAQAWLDERTSALVTGTHVDLKTARMTVSQWCDTWLAGYATRRGSTVRQARVHVARIKTEFGSMRLSSVRPSHVRDWTARLAVEGKCTKRGATGLSTSYVYALHSRLSQVLDDAVRDGILARNPCSRRTSPGAGKQRPYVATTEQVWALHDAVPARYRVAVLLGAFVGLRCSEACGLRVADVDFMRGVVHPTVQYPAVELKTDTSRTPVPIPASLAAELSAHVAEYRAEMLLTNDAGGQLEPWRLERVMRSARAKVAGLPDGFRFQDLRHYLASLLIASGADVKTVQARVRHASAKTTLDTYAHLWPDRDESTREAIDAVLTAGAVHTRSTGGAR